MEALASNNKYAIKKLMTMPVKFDLADNFGRTADLYASESYRGKNINEETKKYYNDKRGHVRH